MDEEPIGTILWRGKWLIALAVAIAVAIALVLTARAAEVYQAGALLQVSTGGAVTARDDPLRTQEAAIGLATTYATLLVDRSFLAEIAPEVAGGSLGTSELKGRLSASALEDTALIRLSARGDSPDEAAALAREVADAFVAYVRAEALERSRAQQDELRARLAALSDEIEEARSAGTPAGAEQLETLRTARAALANQLAGVVANGIQQGGSVALASPPTGSSSPVEPRPLLNVASALLLGLLLGAGLAWLRARLDRGLHSKEEAEELLGAPVLASIPIRKSFSADDPVLGEAYDVLRANLAFMALERQLQVLAVTSYNPREGKSSSVEGLAYAAVRGGLTVVVVDGDVRTRVLSTRLEHADEPGLTNAVVGLAPLDDVLVELAPGLALLPSGPTPPNPPSLLASPQMRDLVAELRERYALVLIDAPPVAHLADASILASVADGIMIAARVGVTEREHLAATAASLRHSPTPIVGSILLEHRTVDQTYYPSLAKGRPVLSEAPPGP